MQIIVGRILSTVVTLFLFLDAAINVFVPHVIQDQIEATGFSVAHAPMLGIIIAICTALYTVRKTAILGAILITGFLGGAIAAHFRLGEVLSPPIITSILLGLATWGGLYLRDERARTLLA
jgi:hypothetical protein